MGWRLPRVRLPGPVVRWIYRSYEHGLIREIRGAPVPGHVGFILDGIAWGPTRSRRSSSGDARSACAR